MGSNRQTSAEFSVTETQADWLAGLRLRDLPEDILEATEARILDVVGLAFLGRQHASGQAVLAGARTLGGPPEAHVVGDRDATGAATAALANGALAEAIEFDDTHSESIVHVGAPVVAAALALAEAGDVAGRDLLAAVAGGAEIACRLGVVAPGRLHALGFHPTGIIGPFGAVAAGGRVMGLTPARLADAAGIVGSQAAGLLACWRDGTQAKAIHPGWAAHSAVLALRWAQAGLTGPARVVEGPAGLFHSHLQDAASPLDFDRATDRLGARWESRGVAFKPYPAAHVLHGLIEAALSLAPTIAPGSIEEVVCTVAPHWVDIVCEPQARKRRPGSNEAARISLHHAVAEALVFGRLDGGSFRADTLDDPRIARLRERIRYAADPAWRDRTRFPGRIVVRLREGGERIAEIASNLGGPDRPLSFDQVAAKVHRNLEHLAQPEIAERICAAVKSLRTGAPARAVAGAWAEAQS